MAEELHEADGVFQGGGVKGIALVGALLEFADEGWTGWKSVAGTSAGSIVASLVACGTTPDKLEEILRSAPYPKFEDFGPGGEVFGGGWNLLVHHGLAHGRAFHDWFDEIVNHKTFEDVRRDGRTLKMIAADTTRKQMLVLPDDLEEYYTPKTSVRIDPLGFKVADAVRMSMSIPFFFEPIVLVHAETKQQCVIVDGGVLSNFPVWLFDVADRDPVRPTFGFRLYGGKGLAPGGALGIVRKVAWPAAFGWDLFQTTMEAWDKRFMSHSTRVRTCAISAEGIGTVDFNLSQADQDKLVASGRHAAKAFLSTFDPAHYFNTFGKTLAPEAVATAPQ